MSNAHYELSYSKFNPFVINSVRHDQTIYKINFSHSLNVNINKLLLSAVI